MREDHRREGKRKARERGERHYSTAADTSVCEYVLI